MAEVNSAFESDDSPVKGANNSRLGVPPSSRQGGAVALDMAQQQEHSAAIDLAMTDSSEPTSPQRLIRVDPSGDSVSKKEDNNNDTDDDDPWNKVVIQEDDSPAWKTLTTQEKVIRVALITSKLFGLLVFLYFFICSLDLLASAFRLCSGRATGELFRDASLLQNKVVGVMLGILATVLVQSSSTSTSIVVSIVASGQLSVETAIPMVMGANVGTSVTNTIVSLVQIGDMDQFRRAFAGATVHDMFNWITVIVLLIVESITGLLFHITSAIVSGVGDSSGKGGEMKLLQTLTEVFTNRVVRIDKNVLKGYAGVRGFEKYAESLTILKNCTKADGSTNSNCWYIFHDSGLSDSTVGIIMLILSLGCLCGCLIMVVKILSSILRGSVAKLVRSYINRDLKYVPWLTGYVAILFGCVVTILIQSSSVFTSILTPLVGLGYIKLDRMYPLTLGSNLGTTTTSVIAALAADPTMLKYTLQIALCHFFFNFFGLLMFYVVPAFRVPVALARGLGNITARYRWFAFAYLLLMFVLLPLFVFVLSLGGPTVLLVFLIPIGLLVLFVLSVNTMRKYHPTMLPKLLNTWDFLPIWFRSLEPYDAIIMRGIRLCPCKKLKEVERTDSRAVMAKNEASSSPAETPVHQSVAVVNPAFEGDSELSNNKAY